MKVPGVVAALGHRVVQGEVRHHPSAGELLANVGLHHGAALVAGQLVRQGNVDLAGQLGIGAMLHSLHRVPKFLAVGQPSGPALGHNDFPVYHPAAAAVVLHLPGPFITERRACSVCRRCHGIVRPDLGRPVQVLAALPAPHDLGCKMIDRQGRLPSASVAIWRHLRRTLVSSWVGGAPMSRSDV